VGVDGEVGVPLAVPFGEPVVVPVFDDEGFPCAVVDEFVGFDAPLRGFLEF
jgi:hypothetical protein